MKQNKSRPKELELNAFFVRWAEIVLRRRAVLLVAILLSTLVLGGLAGTKLLVDTTTEAFMPADSEPALVLDQLRDEFGMDLNIFVVARGDVFSTAYLDRLKKLHNDFEGVDMEVPSLGKRDKERRERRRHEGKLKGQIQPSADSRAFEGAEDDSWGEEGGGSVFDRVTSLINVRRTAWVDGGLDVSGFLSQWPTPAELGDVKQRALADVALANRIVGRDAKHSMLLLRTADMSEADSNRVYYAVLEIAKASSVEGFEVHVAGLPALNAEINAVMETDFGALFSVCVLLMTAILAFLFRSTLGVVGPLFVVIQATMWTLGAMALHGTPITIVTNVMPTLIMCVGMGDSIHIQSVYRDRLQAGCSNHEAIVHALGSTGLPILITSATTCVGLLSFYFASLDAIKVLGLFGALGVALAMLHSLVFLPIVLSFNRGRMGARQHGRREDRLDRFLLWCGNLSVPTVAGNSVSFAKRNVVLGVAFLVIVSSSVAVFRLEVRHNPIEWLAEGSLVRSAMAAVNDNLGGSSNLVLLVSAPEGRDLRSSASLKALDRLQSHIRSYRDPEYDPVVGSVSGILDIVKESNRALHTGDEAYYRIPDEDGAVLDVFTLFENAGADELGQVVSLDFRKTIITVSVRWMDALSNGPLVEHIKRGIESEVGALLDVKVTGTVANVFAVVSVIVTDLIESFLIAFLVITILMVLFFRDLKLGLVASVPNLLPIGSLLAIMAFAGIPLDASNLLLASVAIGIAVDDSVHFHHQFRAGYELHHDTEAALKYAFEHSGRAIVATSIVVAAGFSVFGVASMSNIRQLGGLLGLVVVLAVLSDLVVAPAILRLAYRGDGNGVSRTNIESNPASELERGNV